jgi:hypothetical protein
MPWAKFDDKVIRSRKVRRVARSDPSAVLLWMFAIIYCCEQMTDGEIEGDELRELLPSHHEDHVKALLVAGMLHDKPGCTSPDCLASQGLPIAGSDMYVIHDYAASQILAEDWKKVSVTKSYAAHKRWHLGTGDTSEKCEHCRNHCVEDERCHLCRTIT